MTASSRPSLDVFITDGRLRAQRSDVFTLEQMLDAARRDLDAADKMLEESRSWTEAILYEAGLRCARVIVQAAGWRIAADRGHQTAIDAADGITQDRQHRRLLRLHRMRRVRHEVMYEVGREPSQSDIEQARRDVVALIAEAEAAIGRIALPESPA